MATTRTTTTRSGATVQLLATEAGFALQWTSGRARERMLHVFGTDTMRNRAARHVDTSAKRH